MRQSPDADIIDARLRNRPHPFQRHVAGRLSFDVRRTLFDDAHALADGLHIHVVEQNDVTAGIECASS